MYTVYYTITIEKATLFRKVKTMQMTKQFASIDNARTFAQVNNAQMIINEVGKVVGF